MDDGKEEEEEEEEEEGVIRYQSSHRPFGQSVSRTDGRVDGLTTDERDDRSKVPRGASDRQTQPTDRVRVRGMRGIVCEMAGVVWCGV